jgi:epoxyqueuosine reductase
MKLLRVSPSDGIGWSGAGAQVSSTNMTPLVRAQVTKSTARGLGFDLVGITHAGPSERAAYYREWLAAGYGGTMEYLRRNVHLREAPAGLLAGARSAICVALNYGREEAVIPDSRCPIGRVATYAWGKDYHVVVRAMLIELVNRLRAQLDEPFDWRACVDTAPILERELAARAGLGWIGKNTCLLNQKLGSYLFLGEVITTLDLAADEPVADHCARCTRCLKACPTRAFPAPQQLNAARCISYLTIEHRSQVPDGFHRAMGSWVFGCDVCQQVCPYNRHAPRAAQAEVTKEHTPPYVDLLDLLRMSPADHRRLTHQSAASRAKRSMWRRNGAIALGNAEGLDEPVAAQVRDALAEAAEDDEPIVQHAASRALGRLSERGLQVGGGGAG